ncbi:MAG: hypothetical protein GY943_22530, partial [Chloroflexi bacterium]|nr:hypothetical protein [Chloroflexota bacterium]
MIEKLKTRLLWGIGFALLLSFFSVAVSLADNVTPIGTPDDCLECHEDSVVSWEESAHGNALTNEGFQQMWQEQGEPASCLQCHTTGYNELTGTWDA